MLDFEDLSIYYTDFIKADSNPYKLVTVQTYKNNGELKSKIEQKLISLEEIDPKYLVLKANKIEEIDYYPKSLFKKIFRKKNKVNINVDKVEEYFILTSNKTSKIINTNCTVYDSLKVDNKFFLVKRGKLIYLMEDNKIYSFTDGETIEYHIR